MQRCDLLQVCCGKNLAEIVGWRLIGSYLDWDVAVECVSPSFVLTCDTKCCVCVCENQLGCRVCDCCLLVSCSVVPTE